MSRELRCLLFVIAVGFSQRATHKAQYGFSQPLAFDDPFKSAERLSYHLQKLISLSWQHTINLKKR